MNLNPAEQSKHASKLIIASRESRLAMWQARDVQSRLGLLYPQCSVEILGMTTRGDQILDKSLAKVGGKGLFVKELEVALEEGRADLAVHSLKDVPMELPHGFALAAVLQREDPRDAFVSNQYASLEELPAGAIVGTSSLRRQALLAAKFPALQFKPLRGNLDTRLGKLDAGEYAAIILAVAGLKRLGLAHRIAASLPAELSLPAAGQGAMAIEVRNPTHASTDAGDQAQQLLQMMASLNHRETELAVKAERTVSQIFGGSCQIPLAAYAEITQDAAGHGQMRLRAMVATPDGKQMASADLTSSLGLMAQIGDERALALALDLGQQVAQVLKAQDADGILAVCRAQA